MPVITGRDRRAFEQFAARSADGLVRSAYLLCGDRGHAEDIVQKALLRTARRWRSARERPEAYARQVVVNLVKDHWRSLSRRPREAALDIVLERGLDVPTEGPDLGWVDRDELLQATRSLPTGQRAVLVLRYFDDLSVEETAAALGVTGGTVKSQTARALGNLRAALTQEKETTDADR